MTKRQPNRPANELKALEAPEMAAVEGGVASPEPGEPLPWCTTGLPRDIYGRVIVAKPAQPPVW
jgi:hypothetical protein